MRDPLRGLKDTLRQLDTRFYDTLPFITSLCSKGSVSKNPFKYSVVCNLMLVYYEE